MFRIVIWNIWGGASRRFFQYLFYYLQYLEHADGEWKSLCCLSFAPFLMSPSAQTLYNSKTFRSHDFCPFIFSNGAKTFSVKGMSLSSLEDRTHDESSVSLCASFSSDFFLTEGFVYRNVEWPWGGKHLLSN